MYIRMRVTQAYTRGAMTRYARVYQNYPYRATVAPWVEVARCSTCAWLRARVHKTLCVHWIRPRAAFTRRRRDTGQSIPICFRFRHPLRAPPSYVPGISMIFAWKQIYLASFPPHPTVDFQFLPWIPWGRSTANILVALSLSPSLPLYVYVFLSQGGCSGQFYSPRASKIPVSVDARSATVYKDRGFVCYRRMRPTASTISYLDDGEIRWKDGGILESFCNDDGEIEMFIWRFERFFF